MERWIAKMKVHVNRFQIFVLLGLFYAFFRSHIHQMSLTRIYEYILIAAFFWVVLGNNLRLSKKLLISQMPWVLFMILTFIHNEELARGGILAETNVRLFICYAMILYLPYCFTWGDNLQKCMIRLGMV